MLEKVDTRGRIVLGAGALYSAVSSQQSEELDTGCVILVPD